MKLLSVKVVALWANVCLVLWFGYGMVGMPTHFMAFLFVTGLVVLALLPALWESVRLLTRVMDRRKYAFDERMLEFLESDDLQTRLWVDDYTYFGIFWNGAVNKWDVMLMASDGDVWEFHTLDSASFYAVEDAIWWVESKYDAAGYEMSYSGSIWS